MPAWNGQFYKPQVSYHGVAWDYPEFSMIALWQFALRDALLPRAVLCCSSDPLACLHACDVLGRSVNFPLNCGICSSL